MGMYLIGIIVLGVVVLLGSIWALLSKNYIRIAPNTAAIIFGRKNKAAGVNEDGSHVIKGYRLITGGGVFKMPFFEEAQFMDLSNRRINIKVTDAPNKDGVMTTIEGVANTKIASEIGLLEMAVERFLGKSDSEINETIHETLAGHLRAVVGKMSIEELIGDKAVLNAAIMDEANDDFNKMGIRIDFLNIQDIEDNDNYIKNLGKKRAAQVKRDAEIGTAEAERDSTIRTAEAEREGVEKANENQVKIYQSNQERDVQKAAAKAAVDTQNEIAAQAGPLSQAKAYKAVVTEQANTAAAAELANVKVEEARAEKEKKRYVAETIVPAQAEKEAQIIKADAEKQSSILEAEGERESVSIKAKGEADAVLLKAKAEADGEAAIIEKKGLAEAEVVKQTGLAEAETVKAKLLAEAEGTLKKAEAYEKLDETGKFLEVLNALQTLGPNMIKEFAGVMGAASAHLSNVKDIKIIDFGGKDGGSGSVGNFGAAPLEILNKFFSGMDATGFDTSKLQNFIGSVKTGAETTKDTDSGKGKESNGDETKFDDVK